MKREKLAKFMNVSIRTYNNWKNNEHKNIILILNSVFENETDIVLWTKYKIIPQFKYFKNQEELINKSFRESLCRLLGIELSNYYFWKEGKRSNIINLFIQIFKNSKNVDYWLENLNFEITMDNLKVNEYIKYLEKINNNEFCRDCFININSSFLFDSINIRDFKNYLFLSIDSSNLKSENKIKYQLINAIELTNYIDGSFVIEEYKDFISIINEFDDEKLKNLFDKSIIYKMFIYSIKNNDLNLFIRLFLLICIKLDLTFYLKYLDVFLINERKKLHFEMSYSNINLNLKDIQINVLAKFFIKIISSIDTLSLNDSFCKKDRFNLLLKEMITRMEIEKLI